MQYTCTGDTGEDLLRYSPPPVTSAINSKYHTQQAMLTQINLIAELSSAQTLAELLEGGACYLHTHTGARWGWLGGVSV